MSDLYESLKKLKFDNRMVDWNIRQKVITRKEYDKYISQLKDISHLKNEKPPEGVASNSEETSE